MAIQKYEKHGIEDRDLYIQLHQGRQAIDRFSKVDGLGVQVHFLDFGVGTHHEVLAPERGWEHSIGHQAWALNVGFMEPLHPNWIFAREKIAESPDFRG
ncbi:hypothetical protein D3C80_988580 [compost metagenome]